MVGVARSTGDITRRLPVSPQAVSQVVTRLGAVLAPARSHRAQNFAQIAYTSIAQLWVEPPLTSIA
jgi:hypothetical protein